VTSRERFGTEKQDDDITAAADQLNLNKKCVTKVTLLNFFQPLFILEKDNEFRKLILIFAPANNNYV
jgi:hypothetical protein